MTKIIQFLILGLAILHMSQTNAQLPQIKTTYQKRDISLNQYIKKDGEVTFKEKLSLIKNFKKLDKNGDFVIDSYEKLVIY